MKALLVGIEHYEDWGIEPFRYGVADVMRLGKCLKYRFFFDEADIVILANADGASGRPTIENIMDRLTNWTRLKKNGDETILFYFAGHGMVVGGDSVLLPVNARISEMPAIMKKGVLTFSELSEIFEEIKVGQQIVFLDCCRNAVLKDRQGIKNIRSQIRSRDLKLLVKAGFKRDKSVVQGSAVLFSCREGQRSYEIDELGHGLFGWSLAEVLEKKSEEELDLKKIYEQIDKKMLEMVQKFQLKRQAPDLLIEGLTPRFRLWEVRIKKSLQKRLSVVKSVKQTEPKLFHLLAAKGGERVAKRFSIPSVTLLDSPIRKEKGIHEDAVSANKKTMQKRLLDFGINGRVLGIQHGPVVSVYEFEPDPRIKVNRIVNLADDLALALNAISIRIVAPVPGKSFVGIEIPNTVRETVFLREVIDSDTFQTSKAKLPLALGMDISGKPYVIDFFRMPHLLLAGSTGSEKNVSINSMICSVLFKSTPNEVRLVMIDSKMQELSDYNGIPNLLLPIVNNPQKAIIALKGLVKEMERRYAVLAEKDVRSIEHYHQEAAKTAEEFGRLPYIVVIVDELADLMMIASREVEESITRLAQMAKVVGIHMLLATQHPSVDVLTGIIKANIPARISFQVSSKFNSRTILDTTGAEHLLGSGDMLFLLSESSKLIRLHGPFISSQEVKRIVDFLKKQEKPSYEPTIDLEEKRRVDTRGKENVEYDGKYEKAVAFVADVGEASISLIQRRFRIGYNRAARFVEKMEEDGIVGSAVGLKPRKVLVKKIE